jgi:putative addiction module killer protein
MLPLVMLKMIEFTEYIDANGKSPFAQWFDALDAVAAAKVRVYMTRVELGKYSNVKPIGVGLSEIKIDLGPEYRVYFRKEREILLLLLGGSNKKGQQKAISAAKLAWKKYESDRKQNAQKEKRK